MTPEDVVAMQNEIDIMREVDHPNVVKMSNVYEDKNHYCLVMELMTGGEVSKQTYGYNFLLLIQLFDHIIEKETFDEEMAQKIMTPVFDAVIYCHERNIVHRDIKPENLLLSGKNLDDSIIKISDFGLARYINASSDELATTTCGTPGYVAPEILHKKPYDHRCDYWSLAVVLFIMLSGTPPFYHEDNFELFEIIKKGEYDFDAPAWKLISNEAKDLINRLLTTDPDKRITAEEIRVHPWISGEYKAQKKNLNNLEGMRGWNTRRKLMPDQQ